MKAWLDIPKESKINIFKEIEDKTRIKPIAIEKDWWVVQTLRLIFDMDVADFLVFKGGYFPEQGMGIDNPV